MKLCGVKIGVSVDAVVVVLADVEADDTDDEVIVGGDTFCSRQVK